MTQNTYYVILLSLGICPAYNCPEKTPVSHNHIKLLECLLQVQVDKAIHKLINSPRWAERFLMKPEQWCNITVPGSFAVLSWASNSPKGDVKDPLNCILSPSLHGKDKNIDFHICDSDARSPNYFPLAMHQQSQAQRASLTLKWSSLVNIWH